MVNGWLMPDARSSLSPRAGSRAVVRGAGLTLPERCKSSPDRQDIPLSASRIADNAPSTTVLLPARGVEVTPPAARGEQRDAHSRSRDACAPEACRPKVRILFASKKKKGGGAPKRRDCLVGPRHAIRCCHLLALRAWPRVQRNALAFRRSTAVLASAMCRSSIQAALRAMQCAGVTRTLALRLSEAPRAPVVMPAGSMPGPPESGSDEPPPAGTAPTPSVGVTG